MMAGKYLHELLREDQEPFQLKSYIADRRCQLKKPSPKTTLQVKKRRPIVETSTPKRVLCNHACLFSFQDSPSPDVRKSKPKPPFLEFQSPAKSPCNNNTVFLHTPARTAAMLLDAAIRIQKQSSKPKSETKNSGFGLIGSILKRLKDRSNRTTKRREIGGVSVNASERKNWKTEENVVSLDEKSGYEMGRLSSADWSESNGEKSLDLETSCSSRSENSEEIEFVAVEREIDDFSSSPFRFSLQKSPSPGRRTPDFLSPVASPSRHCKEEKESCEAESSQEVPVEAEEEKEQFSPVSVLDTPFEDDDDEEGHEGGDEEEDDYDVECSYANVQKAKHQLLQKLRRFERLAELDPIELEKRMLEQLDDEGGYEDQVEEEDCDGLDSALSCEENATDFVREVLSKSGIHHLSKVPKHVKRLVSDLITEENKNEEEGEVVVKRVCKRLDSWKVVESNTIDMMVELEFSREVDGWKRCDQEQITETGMDIEVAIFGLLVEELSEELVSVAGH